jgi:multiple sugar transport system permease protein
MVVVPVVGTLMFKQLFVPSGLVSWFFRDILEHRFIFTEFSVKALIIVNAIWGGTPFPFIVLYAGLLTLPSEQVEAAVMDGANRWQIFRYITLPEILPVSLTVVLIRLIEAFKIMDLPNVLTNGGPGTATESLTLQAFITWRALDLGGSAAIAYMLLFLVTFVALVYVHLIRNRAVEAL